MVDLRRFNSLADAKRYIYSCLASSLENDLDNGSDFIFDDEFSESDRKRVETAVHRVIEELERKAQPRGKSR